MKNYLLVFGSRAGTQYHTVYASDEQHANQLGEEIAQNTQLTLTCEYAQELE
jgi:hypothetical protein